MTVDELLSRHGIKLESTAPGRYYTTCPVCSPKRSKAHQKVLGVTIESDGSVRWGCNHCSWTGPEKGSGGGGGNRGNITYEYHDADGALSFQKVRNPPGSKNPFYCRRPDGAGGWVNGLKGIVSKPLYRWPEILRAMEQGREIALAEGEKDCDRLWSLDIPATCNFDGAPNIIQNPKARKWKPEYSERLRGARIVVFNDNDAQGYAHADHICRDSNNIAARVRRLDLAPHWPDMPKGADVSDWLALGHTREELAALIAGAPDYVAPQAEPSEQKQEPPPQQERPEKHKAADVLIALSAGANELFHCPDGTAYAIIQVGDHLETWPVRSKGFRRWLAREYFNRTSSAPNSDAIQSALNVIEARAHFDGKQRTVHIRVGACDGRLYLDLADAQWRAVEIDADGWRIVARPPIAFRRAAGMQALPQPVHGGSIGELRTFLNVGSENENEPDHDFVLAVSFILAALRDRGPYPVLCLAGEHGSAKSTFTAVLRRLIDPNSAALRALPREDRDLFIAANNAHLLAFDNISHLPDWISDTLCRLATGGGFATRQLYSDLDESLFDAMRPIILNGIEDIVGRPDLADRSVFLGLKNIEEDKRKSELAFWSDFERAHPRILGALLGAVVHGLRQLPNTRLTKTPRMADFALWATACETAFWQQGAFARAYQQNRDDAVSTVIEADLVATAVQSFIAARTEWTGTSSDLLGALKMAVGEDQARLKEWPATPRALSGKLRRAAATLRKVGVEVTFDRTSGGSSGGKRTRKIIIARMDEGNDRPHRPYRPQSQDINDIDGDGSGDGSGDGRDDDGATVPPTVPPNPLKNHKGDGPDGRDAKIPTHTGGRARSDDLPYTGPIVDVPDQGPDILDAHGAPSRSAPSTGMTCRSACCR